VSKLAQVIFPASPRSLRWRRGLKIGLRAAHVLCASVLTGGTLLGAPPDRIAPWLTATAVSGLSIVLLDLHESGAFLLQLRGAVVLVKIGLLAALPWLAPWRAGIFTSIVLISVLSSHAPSGVRYLMLFGRDRIKPGRSKG
jgi:hypothetical protein